MDTWNKWFKTYKDYWRYLDREERNPLLWISFAVLHAFVGVLVTIAIIDLLGILIVPIAVLIVITVLAINFSKFIEKQDKEND